MPAGGLFSGAEGIKTPEQESIYGGFAGMPYDECYHQACDSMFNLNHTALDQMSRRASRTRPGRWRARRARSPWAAARPTKKCKKA